MEKLDYVRSASSIRAASHNERSGGLLFDVMQFECKLLRMVSKATGLSEAANRKNRAILFSTIPTFHRCLEKTLSKQSRE